MRYFLIAFILSSCLSSFAMDTMEIPETQFSAQDLRSMFHRFGPSSSPITHGVKKEDERKYKEAAALYQQAMADACIDRNPLKYAYASLLLEDVKREMNTPQVKVQIID